MPGSSGPVSCLRQKQEVSLEPLALQEHRTHFSGLASFVTTELIVKRSQIIFVVFQIQSKS